jgi:hypothetical protein
MKYKILAVLFLSFIITKTFAQAPVNDVCSGALTVPVGINSICVTTKGSTLNATDNNEAGDCITGTERSVWYKFVATQTTTTLTVTGDAGFDPVVSVHNTCGSGTAPAGGTCTDLTGSAGTETLSLTGLTIGTTYFIQIHDFQGDNTAASTFSLCLTVPDPPVLNNTCANATTLVHGANCSFTPGSTINATDENATGDCTASGIGAPQNSVWYKFVATNDTAIVSVQGSFTTSDMVIGALTTCGTTVRPIGGSCTDATTGGGLEQMTLTGLTIGNTYFVQVHDYYAVATNFEICIASPITATGTGGATCATEAPVCTPLAFGASSAGSLAEAGNNYGCLTTQPNPTWFYAQMSSSGTINLNIASTSDIDYAVWGPYTTLTAAKAVCGSLPAPISCGYSTSANENATFTGNAGDVFVILVTNYSGAAQNIALTSVAGSTATLNCSIVLPVKLLNFTAALQSNNSALLQWATSTEINSKDFIIEKSQTGNNWITLGSVAAAGYSSVTKNYSFIDPKPFSGITYYRLKQVDLNSSFEYSDVRTVRTGKSGQIVLTPNPASSGVNIIMDKALTENTIVKIVNNAGQTMASLTMKKGEAQKYISLSGYAKGTYNVVIQNTQISETQKLVLN